jgi:hypothetical protein
MSKSRSTPELEEHRKLFWHHLFSDDQLKKLSDVVNKTFTLPLRIDDEFIIRSPNIRQEIAKILHEVAEQNGFKHNQVLDNIHMVDDYIKKSGPRTFAVLKNYPQFWLYIPVEQSSKIMSIYKISIIRS